jgi:hypothetical protein
MARLPSGRYLIQQVGPDVILFEEHSEHQLASFRAHDGRAAQLAQAVIDASELSEQDKAAAHFWSGYFFGQAH